MHLLWTLLIGLVIGAVAKFIMPGKDPGGIIITMLIGIAGSFLATWAGRAIGWYRGRTSRGLHHVSRRSHRATRPLSPGQTENKLSTCGAGALARRL